MPTSFLSLPAEIRNEIYRYLVVSSNEIDIVHGLPSRYIWRLWNRPEIDVSILYVNKAIHHEACFLLYSQNYFNFDVQYSQFEIGFGMLFLEKIGSVNASYLRYLKIPFPNIFNIESATTPEQPYNLILEQIQHACSSLRSIELFPAFDTGDVVTQWNRDYYREFSAEDFAQINTRLRAIQSLREIRVSIFLGENNLVTDVVREMESQGWIVRQDRRPDDHALTKALLFA